MKSSEFHTHITILGWINIGLSAMFLFVGIFGFFFLQLSICFFQII